MMKQEDHMFMANLGNMRSLLKGGKKDKWERVPAAENVPYIIQDPVPGRLLRPLWNGGIRLARTAPSWKTSRKNTIQ